MDTDRKRGGLICEGEGFVAVGINNLPGLAGLDIDHPSLDVTQKFMLRSN